MHEDELSELARTIAEFHGFTICEEPWTLYYDETENCRSISYGNNGIKDRRPFKRDFILGGIMTKTSEAKQALIDGARTLPAPNGEIKSKSVLGGSKDFLAVLKRREVTGFLRLINQPDVCVHYHSQDNLYFSIVDIVDSLIALPENEMMAAYHLELKDALYRAVSPCRIDFLEALMHFGYPNIASSEVAPFCRCIEELLRTARDNDESEPAAQFFTETLRQMMKAATKADVLVFLDGNPERVLVDGYWSHYLTTCIVLPHATHFFDNESRVSEALSGTTNCVFVDSKSEPLIQLSDVWVGLLSRLYQFLDERSLNYRQIDTVRAALQLENLRTIKRLIDRADATHKSLLSQTAPPSVVYTREQVLQSLCEGKNSVSFRQG